MRKRVFAKALAFGMMLSVAASESTVTTFADEEPVKLIFYMAAAGNMEDAPLVEEKINEYIEPLIGANVELNYINMGSYSEQIGMMVRSGEQIDVVFSFMADARNFIRQDSILPLDDLLESDGEGIVDAIGAQNLEACRVRGELYSLPSMKDMAISRAFLYDQEMADAAGVDLSNVKTLEDLTDIFAKVKEKYPDVAMFGGAGGNSVIFQTWMWDNLADSLGVLMDNGQSTTIENLFATDEYMELCKLMRSWYEAGYIEKDFATSSEIWVNRVEAGTAFGGITAYKPGAVETAEGQTGKDLGCVILTDPVAYTDSIANVNWMIPASTVDEHKAMQFLRLMYTDPTLANLLLNGIEGVHFERNEDGTISRIDPDNNKYQNFLQWAMGNQFITDVWEGNDLDIYEKTREYNDTAIKSAALGFSYDNSHVLNQITACNNVLNKYRVSLECGSVDPESTIPDFLKELESAGINDIIAEKQAQFEEWRAE